MWGQSVSQAGVQQEQQGGVCRLQQAELHMDRFTLQEADGQLSFRVEAGEGRICETEGRGLRDAQGLHVMYSFLVMVHLSYCSEI